MGKAYEWSFVVYRFLSYLKRVLGETVALAKLPISEYTIALEMLPQNSYKEI